MKLNFMSEGMNGRELRRGDIICLIDRSNEIHLPIEIFPYVVSEIGMFHAKIYPLGKYITQVEHIKVYLNDVSPIKLTEDWLLNLGFVKTHNVGTDNEWYWKGPGMDLTLELMLSTSDRHYESMPVDNSIPIKYLHQLQNLYFALTGGELELKKTELTS